MEHPTLKQLGEECPRPVREYIDEQEQTVRASVVCWGASLLAIALVAIFCVADAFGQEAAPIDYTTRHDPQQMDPHPDLVWALNDCVIQVEPSHGPGHANDPPAPPWGWDLDWVPNIYLWPSYVWWPPEIASQPVLIVVVWLY